MSGKVEAAAEEAQNQQTKQAEAIKLELKTPAHVYDG
jgi:hypothetical protein